MINMYLVLITGSIISAKHLMFNVHYKIFNLKQINVLN